jgi:hypothetical protein
MLLKTAIGQWEKAGFEANKTELNRICQVLEI